MIELSLSVYFHSQINRLHVPTLPLTSGFTAAMPTVTPISSPSKGGLMTSSRPPSATNSRFDRFDDEVYNEHLNVFCSISLLPTRMYWRYCYCHVCPAVCTSVNNFVKASNYISNQMKSFAPVYVRYYYFINFVSNVTSVTLKIIYFKFTLK